jgi:GEVED domain/Fibronectin type III domain/Secretion system C-terminal sorting domain
VYFISCQQRCCTYLSPAIKYISGGLRLFCNDRFVAIKIIRRSKKTAVYLNQQKMKQLFTLLMTALVLLGSLAASAQCGAPSNLAAVYSNNVSTFSWNVVASAVNYTIEIKQPQDDWNVAEIAETVTDTFYNSTGIFHSATLDWRVTANCGSSVSSYTVAQYTVPCPEPTSLNVTNITAGSAALNWVAAAGYNTLISDFVVSYRLANTSNAWTQIGHTSAFTINVTGLSANTAYEWCVNQTCVYFNSNPVISSFTTAMAPCAAPTGLSFSYSNNISTFNWDAVPGASGYRIQFGWAGAPGGGPEIAVTTNSYAIPNLMQGGNFQIKVRAVCGSTFSPYTSLLFSTPCLQPYSLSTTNITTTSATLNWQQSTTTNNNNTGFSVSYRLANTNNAWIQLTDIYNNPTATFFNLTGLTPGTAYEWRVRRVCSVSNSNYITSQFVTLSCISNGVNSGEWIDFFSLGAISRVSGAEPGGYANVAANTNLVIGSATNPGQISAGFSGTVRNQRFSVYIDFNRNGSFADAGEQLVNAASMNNAGIFSFNVSIPATATAGTTRMRVMMRRNPGAISPCITGYLGETEDYTVTLQSASRSAAPSVADANEKTKTIISASPNPSNGVFTIQMPVAIEAVSYEVLNSNGMSVKRGATNNTRVFKIDITTLPAGLYMVRITDRKNKVHIQKISKQ